jgi:opacity protein-like surface antigen
MKKILLAVSVALISQVAMAQHNAFVMSYPIAFPMGNLHDYIGQTSFRGFNMEFNRRQKPNLEFGLETGWQTFYQREESKAYTSGTATISGIQYRYTNIAPILASVKFYKVSGKTEPYLGLGLGVMYVNRSTDFGLYRISTEVWPFTLRPEAGVLFHFQPGVSGLLGVKYYAAFNTDDLDGQSFLSINIGVVLSH